MLDVQERRDDEKLPLCYNKSRHQAIQITTIEPNVCNNLWRMRERVSMCLLNPPNCDKGSLFSNFCKGGPTLGSLQAVCNPWVSRKSDMAVLFVFFHFEPPQNDKHDLLTSFR